MAHDPNKEHVVRGSHGVRATVLVVGALLGAAGTAFAHPMDANTSDDNWLMRSLAEHGKGHGAAGAEPNRSSVGMEENRNLEVVGRFDTGGKLGGLGRVADVSAKGNYAYLTMFYEPTCGRGGVQVVDISDPVNPKAGAYITSHVDTFSG